MRKFSSYLPKLTKTKKIIFITIALILVISAVVAWQNPKVLADIKTYLSVKNIRIKGIILFYGTNCSYCEKVETFIKNNKVEESVSFTRLEVFHDSFNASVLADKAHVCGLDDSHIGVPFLWDGKQCVVGYVDVIKFFQDKIAKKP